MDIRLQAKLLRAIQEREIDRVGGSHPVKVDIRVLATSNRKLEEEVARRPVPRGPATSASTSSTCACRRCASVRPTSWRCPTISPRNTPRPTGCRKAHSDRRSADAAEGASVARQCPRAREHDAPRRAAVARPEIDTDAILLTDGAPSVAAPTPPRGRSGRPRPHARALVGRTVADVERDLIIDTLHHCLGNRTHAATILGISIRTLRNKLKQYSEEGVRRPAAGRRGTGRRCEQAPKPHSPPSRRPRHDRPNQRRQFQRGGSVPRPPRGCCVRGDIALAIGAGHDPGGHDPADAVGSARHPRWRCR